MLIDSGVRIDSDVWIDSGVLIDIGVHRGHMAACPTHGFVVFPNETSFWETPLRIKEIAGDSWENLISGPNPAAVSWWGGCFFSRGKDFGK